MHKKRLAIGLCPNPLRFPIPLARLRVAVPEGEGREGMKKYGEQDRMEKGRDIPLLQTDRIAPKHLLQHPCLTDAYIKTNRTSASHSGNPQKRQQSLTIDDASPELSVPTANQKNAITRCTGEVYEVRGRRRE